MQPLPAGPVLVVGLGNPGPRYEGTRHNLGFRAVQELADRLGVGITRRGHQSLWGEGRHQGRKIVLALPQTYMNLSGQAVASLAHYYDLEPQRVVVAHDDLDQEPGRLKIALKGGAGGHKGVASIMQHLGSDQFIRLKLGIGRPRYGENIEDYVLSGFYADQRGVFDKVTVLAAECLAVILEQGPQAAMQRYHGVSLKEEVEG